MATETHAFLFDFLALGPPSEKQVSEKEKRQITITKDEHKDKDILPALALKLLTELFSSPTLIKVSASVHVVQYGLAC